MNQGGMQKKHKVLSETESPVFTCKVISFNMKGEVDAMQLSSPVNLAYSMPVVPGLSAAKCLSCPQQQSQKLWYSWGIAVLSQPGTSCGFALVRFLVENLSWDPVSSNCFKWYPDTLTTQ